MHRSKLFMFLIAALLMIPNLGLGLAAQQAPGAYGEQPPPARGVGAAVAGHDGNGPFGPPLNPDSTFSADSDSPLDEYIYNDEQISDIGVLIGRVLGETDYNGQLSDSETLIANEILAPKARLHILAWDVDVDYKGTDVQPEIDQVYLNGEYLGNLNGANDTWSVSSFEFDSSMLGYGTPRCDEDEANGLPSYLSMCSGVPYDYENRIEIIIDSANSTPVWGTEIDWAAISFEAARPTLFVHGRGGHLDEASGTYPASGETFDPGGQSQYAWVNPSCYFQRNFFGCQYWDRDDAGYFFNFRGRVAQYGLLTQITENELVGENSTLTNAELLAESIELMKQRYGVQKINIVAHGKGGLDARAYISDPILNAADDVAALITLSSPHQGSYLASLASNLPFFTQGKLGEAASPALGSVTEAYISDLFNPSHAGRWDVAYYSISGEAGSQAAYGSDMPPEQVDAWPFLSQQAAAPYAWSVVMNSGDQAGVNDGQVSAASGNLAGTAGHLPTNTIDLGVLARNHHSMRAALSLTGVEDNTVVDLLESVLDIAPGYGSAG